MGREIRRVPADWEHPVREGTKRLIPLYDGYTQDLKDFADKIESDGLVYALDYFGGGPLKDDYMPDWPKEERTHYMMYETCSEGTPISPAFLTPEELARWLADTGASSFGGMTSTYEEWLICCKGRSALSAVFTSEKGMQSGVSAMANLDKKD